jgi:hypothetical protein
MGPVEIFNRRELASKLFAISGVKKTHTVYILYSQFCEYPGPTT